MGRPRKRRRSNAGEGQEMPGEYPELVEDISDPWPVVEEIVRTNENYQDPHSWPLLADSSLDNFLKPGNQPISIMTPKPMPEIDFSDWQAPDISIVSLSK